MTVIRREATEPWTSKGGAGEAVLLRLDRNDTDNPAEVEGLEDKRPGLFVEYCTFE